MSKHTKKTILLYNWVQFDDSQMRGGGVSIYLKNMIPEYARHGHEVVFLSAGDQYSFFTDKIFYEQTENEFQNLGVKSYRIVNSPIVAPAHHSFGKILDCRENLPIADSVTGFIEDCGGFDQIQIHNIEGISTITIEKIKEQFPDTKLIVWFHNYHWICPQIELFKDHKQICTDYNEGMDCVGCLSFIQNSDYIKSAQKVKRLAKKLGIKDTRFEKPFYSLFRSGSELMSGVKSVFEYSSPKAQISWKTKISTQNKTINDIEKVGKLFKNWRVQNIKCLNQNADIMFAVSYQVKAVFEGYGIVPSKIFSVPLGMDVYKNETEVQELIKKPRNGKLTIGFFGYPIPSKGSSFFLEALQELPQKYLDKLNILIVSKVDDWTKRKLVRLSTRTKVSLLDGYMRSELPEIAQTVDLGIVPSLWLETFNQVSYELIMNGVPVIVSDTVGIKELLDEDMIFVSGSSQSLRDQIIRFIDNPSLITNLGLKQYPSSLKFHFRKLFEVMSNV